MNRCFELIKKNELIGCPWTHLWNLVLMIEVRYLNSILYHILDLSISYIKGTKHRLSVPSNAVYIYSWAQIKLCKYAQMQCSHIFVNALTHSHLRANTNAWVHVDARCLQKKIACKRISPANAHYQSKFLAYFNRLGIYPIYPMILDI